MASMTIDVATSPGISVDDHEGLRNAVREAIAEHIRSREDLIQDFRVNVTVTECVCMTGRAAFAVTLDGQINGMPVTRKVRAVRSPDSLRSVGGGTAFGLGEVVSRMLVGLAFGVFGTDAGAKILSQCFAECMAELALAIDASAGHQESLASRTWKRITLFRWIATAGMLAACTAPFVMHRGFMGFAALFLPGMLLGPSVFGLIHVAGLAIMPTGFFLRDPCGQKALARSGVRSVALLRVLCAVLAMVFLAVLALCAMMTVEMLSK
ncbi:MAG: hypothetical protein ABFD16_17755 [Thermoguttaceae bacterium]